MTKQYENMSPTELREENRSLRYKLRLMQNRARDALKKRDRAFQALERVGITMRQPRVARKSRGLVDLVPEYTDGVESYRNPTTKNTIYVYTKVSPRTKADLFFVSRRHPSEKDPSWRHLQPIPEGYKMVHPLGTPFSVLKRCS